MEKKHQYPNFSENKLLSILTHNFPHQWHYTGGGSKIIGGKNPDFVNRTAKIVIEYNGLYWHTSLKGVSRIEEETQRVAHFAQHGYRCLCIWGNEIKDEAAIVARVKAFSEPQSL